MLIDDYLPRYDVRERHRTRVAASPEVTYAALHTADLRSSLIVRALLLARALPGALARGRAGVRALRARGTTPLTLAALEATGFRVLAAAPPTEIVLGLEGRFWRVRDGAPHAPAAPDFWTRAPAPGTARGVWSFHLAARPDGTTELTTETRVRCADAGARRRFLPYWYLIRPGSGIIRRAMLRAIRRSAEAGERVG